MKEQWLHTTEVFDDYERRFAKARAEKPLTQPWLKADRDTILHKVKAMLSYDEALVPSIRDLTPIHEIEMLDHTVTHYRFRSWDRCWGATTLYLPKKEGKLPLVFVCCGHGDDGRLTEDYMAMGHRLASLGIAALVTDNIGQGDRSLTPGLEKGPDHWWSVAPFACGLTLQGMIVMETVALIRHFAKDPRFDASRLGACGNSGGGTLTLFLSALAPELSVISSSGYPSEIPFVLQKERPHCACNLLPGSAYGPEMWEIYSLFAPKPMFLEGGTGDTLIPLDLAHRNARKVRNTYMQMDAGDNFEMTLTPTLHSWELIDNNLISKFLCQRLLGITPEDATELVYPDDISELRIQMPEEMLPTDKLAQEITGISVPENIELWNVYKPAFQGRPLENGEILDTIGRGNLWRIFAQFECALTPPKEKQ